MLFYYGYIIFLLKHFFIIFINSYETPQNDIELREKPHNKVDPETKFILDSVNMQQLLQTVLEFNIDSTCSNYCHKHLHFNTLIELTLNCNKDISADWITNAIVSSTSVQSFILFTTDIEREGNRTVVRNSCPGAVWFWFTIDFTSEID